MNTRQKAAEIRKTLPENFCPLPFTQLFFYPTGEVYTCCEISHRLGKMPESTIEEIWNGKILQDLREEFLTGKTKTCAFQIKNKRCHLANEHLLLSTTPTKIQKKPVRAYDLMLNGKCNLECVMCPVWTLPNGIYDQSTFWKEGTDTVFPHLEQVSVKSGEPFIQKDTYRLISQVAAVNKKCRWSFTTNGQYKLTPYILEHLDKIKIESIKVSIDSLLPEIYPKIRLRGDIKKVLETLEGFVDYRKARVLAGRPFLLGVNMAIQRQNWREAPEMVAFCHRRGITPIFLYVFKPDKESLSLFSNQERMEILEFYLSFLEEDPSYAPHFTTLMAPLMNTLPKDEHLFDFKLRWSNVKGASLRKAPSRETLKRVQSFLNNA